jgi:hypothetical protein
MRKRYRDHYSDRRAITISEFPWGPEQVATKRVHLDNRSELTSTTKEQRIKEQRVRNNLQNMVLVAVLASFTGTATYALQTHRLNKRCL